MKFFMQKFIIIAAVLGSASAGFAYSYGSSVSYNYSNEILTNFTYGHMYSEENCKGCSTTTDIAAMGTYLRTINANIQAGGQVGIESISGGGDSHTLLTLMALGVYNLDTNFKDAIFIEAGLGILPVLDNGTYDNSFSFLAGVGKRFPLWDRISYVPTLDIVKKGSLDMGFEIQFINFSFMF